MKKLFLSLPIVLSLLVLGTGTSHAENFLVMAPPYPPYSVSQGLKVAGMTVDILKTLMDMCNAPISEKEIKLTQWAYAYETAASEPKKIVLNAQRTPTTEHLYKWVGPVTSSKTVLVGKRGRNLFIMSKSDLKNYRVASIRWSRQEKALIAGGMPVEDLQRFPTHVEALRWLANDDVDLVAMDQLGAPRLLRGLGMRQSDYSVCYTFREEPLYFAFSRDTDDTLIARLNHALQDFKATGKNGQSQFDQMFPELRELSWNNEAD